MIHLQDALRAAINVLWDSAETGRMPSGQPLDGPARGAHMEAVERLGRLLGIVVRAENISCEDEAQAEAEIRAAVDSDADAAPILDEEWFREARIVKDGKVVMDPAALTLEALIEKIEAARRRWILQQGAGLRVTAAIDADHRKPGAWTSAETALDALTAAAKEAGILP